MNENNSQSEEQHSSFEKWPAESFSANNTVYTARVSNIDSPHPKQKKYIGVGGIIAICLSCFILAAAMGIGGTLLFMKRFPDNTSAEVITDEEQSNLTESTEVKKPVLVTSSSSSSDEVSPEEIYSMACEQVVGITTEITYYNIFNQRSSGVVSGTGFILTEDGYIMTNYHVIESAYEGGYNISVLTKDGTEYAAEVVGVEDDNDIAVLKIDATGLSPVTLGDSNEMHVGQTIYTVGNPLGELDYTMTSGIVSALNRTIQTDASTSVNMFQIDAAVNSGNSGGPIYNSCGQVIGIVTAKYSETGVEGLGFGIPISDAYYIANELITNGYVSGKAHMGITIVSVSSTAAQYYNMVEGAYINSVEEGSCSEEAGLKTGDIITAVGDSTISNQEDLLAAVKKYHAGDTASFTVYRDEEYIEVTVTFDEEEPEEETEESELSEDDNASSEPYNNESDLPEIFGDMFEQHFGY